MQNVKAICFDMDGTIANLYGVENWLEMLRAYDPTPYEVAKPMFNPAELLPLLERVQAIGIEVRIITWLSRDSTTEYDNAVRVAKRNWLVEQNFPFDHFHGVRYGATKANSVRKVLGENEQAILFDDNERVRNGWHLGDAFEPSEIVRVLQELVGE